MMHEIVPGIFTWPWFSERHGYNFNGYLVCSGDGNLCIDPAEPDVSTLNTLTRTGVARIVLTNRNHCRAANLVRARTGACTMIHPTDAAHARAQGTLIDGDLHIGEHIGPFLIVGVAGKSPGEIALYWQERRLLIVGDAVIGHPPGHCGLLPERVIDDPAQLRASLRRLRTLEFDTLLVGDGASILTNARDRLQELLDNLPA